MAIFTLHLSTITVSQPHHYHTRSEAQDERDLSRRPALAKHSLMASKRQVKPSFYYLR